MVRSARGAEVQVVLELWGGAQVGGWWGKLGDEQVDFGSSDAEGGGDRHGRRSCGERMEKGGWERGRRVRRRRGLEDE